MSESSITSLSKTDWSKSRSALWDAHQDSYSERVVAVAFAVAVVAILGTYYHLEGFILAISLAIGANWLVDMELARRIRKAVDHRGVRREIEQATGIPLSAPAASELIETKTVTTPEGVIRVDVGRKVRVESNRVAGNDFIDIERMRSRSRGAENKTVRLNT